MISHYTYETGLGSVTFIEEDGALLAISMQRSLEGVEKETSLTKEAYAQLSEYLNGKRKTFDLPFKMRGTQFQVQVWNALLDIPYGETRS